MSGIILAGGANKRMNGRNKSLLPVGDESMIELQVRKMQTVCEEIIVVTNDASVYSHLSLPSVRFVKDIFPQFGPLSGIHAGLSYCKEEVAWIVACDEPFISAIAAQHMRERLKETSVDAVIPWVQNYAQMLHGIYTKACVTPISNLLKANKYRLTHLLNLISWARINEAEWQKWGISPHFTWDVDTPEQYEYAMQKLSELK